jgi:TatD DNase family protein
MKICDSHCHLDDAVLWDRIDEVIENAKKSDVIAMMAPGIDRETSLQLVGLADRFEAVYAAVGIHPNHSKEASEEILTELKGLIRHKKVKAWGEIGLDFNRPWCPHDIQKKWLVRQLEIALEVALPIILHERDTNGALLSVLQMVQPSGWRGVIHCFSGTEEELQTYLELGLYIGITGVVTHSKRGEALREMLPRIPLERILIETDAPYLTPAPRRNQYKQNEPAFVVDVLQKIAEVRNEPVDKLAAIFWENTCAVFDINVN